jgi:hypothetical protein
MASMCYGSALFAFFLSAVCCPNSLAAPPQRWALLIGVNDYVDFKDLRFAGADAAALGDSLAQSGFQRDHIFLLHDSAKEARYKPFKLNIDKQLSIVLNLAGPDDLVIVSFSGHGIHVDGKSFLCPSEADDTDPAGTMIAVDDIYKKFDGCKAALKLLVVDACRNDPRPATRKSATPEADRKNFAASFERPPDGIVVLTSCGPGQISYEDEKLKHGVFMHYLLSGLSGQADGNRNGRVTLGELYDYTSIETKTYVARAHNDFQMPGQRGEINGVFEFDFAASVTESSSRFTGTWRGSDGQVLYFNLRLVTKGKAVNGEFLWTLAGAPAGSLLAQMVGQSGKEYVEGTFEPVSRRYDLRGVRLTNDRLLALDQYRLLVSPDGEAINGSTRGNRGDWSNTLRGTRVH